MSSGTSSYFGYEYQFYVSVWLMLLSHKKRNSNFARIGIETLFGQDIELLMEGELSEERENSLDLTQEFNNYSLQIQVKTRLRGKQWSSGDIRKVLLKRDETETTGKGETVVERLARLPNEAFVFITNGVVSPDLAVLLSDIALAIETDNIQRDYSVDEMDNIRKVLVEGKADRKNKELLKKHLTPEIINKIHILDALDIDSLRIKIETILEREYRIQPYTKAQRMLIQLLDRVRDAARGNGTDICIEELTSILGDTSPELPFAEIDSVFQETPDYNRAVTKLNKNHMVLLVGEPGVGKSTIGRKLVNDLFNNDYGWAILPVGNYREVYKACQESTPMVLLIDDPFGDSTFNNDTSFGNSLPEIATQLRDANDKVKLVLTSRRNVLSEVIESTKLLPAYLNTFRVDVSEPSTDLQKNVLRTYLRYFQCIAENTDLIVTSIDWQSSPFEDLLHVHDFAQSISEVDKIPDSLHELLSSSKPSNYVRWLKSQPPKIQLFLFILWMVIDVNQVAKAQDLRRVFDNAAKQETISTIMDYDGSGFHYFFAQETLRIQDRIKVTSEGEFTFIHPKLKSAVKELFEKQPQFVELSLAIIQVFSLSVSPLEQSIAAMLSTIYFDQLGISTETFQDICYSRFLQTRDTIIRFGEYLLQHENEEIRQLMDSFYSIRYSPGTNCILDDNNHLIVKENAFGMFTHPQDFLNLLQLSEEVEEYEPLFQQVVSSKIMLNKLNPIEKYWFVLWLTPQVNRPVSNDKLIQYFDELALDQTSFVRSVVATQMGSPDLLEMEEVDSILKALCYDSSPYVKIDVLENIILPNWANLPPQKQLEMLALVVDMLDDPIFRRSVARGLVDQSGTLYHYHENHTREQKQQWFEAVAPKLLRLGFYHNDDFDRFLAAFDNHTKSLSVPFRTTFLHDVTNFVDEYPHEAVDVTYTIKRLTFLEQTTSDEHSLLLKLMNRLPTYARAELSFDFAESFNDLPNDEYRNFIYRPFYMETSEDFVLERTASILGFLENPETTLENLPKPISELSDNVQVAIEEYIKAQSDDFKLILIFHVFGYEWFTQTAARSTNLHSHPIVENLVGNFLQEDPGSKANISIIDVILRSAYGHAHWGSEEYQLSQDKWSNYLDIILESQNVDLGKTVCDILFHSNIVSAVHRFHDWLIMLHRLLTHQNSNVREYAIMLFNRHFHKVWKDLISHGDEDVYSFWSAKEFTDALREKSRLFDFALNLMGIRQSWDTLVEYQKQYASEYIQEASVLFSDFQTKWLVYKFLEELGERLTDSQSTQLYRSVFEGKDSRREIDIPGRVEQLELDHALDDEMPKFDWSKYI